MQQSADTQGVANDSGIDIAEAVLQELLGTELPTLHEQEDSHMSADSAQDTADCASGVGDDAEKAVKDEGMDALKVLRIGGEFCHTCNYDNDIPASGLPAL